MMQYARYFCSRLCRSARPLSLPFLAPQQELHRSLMRCSMMMATRAYSDDDDKNALLTVALLGPPNSGKSTLFNRLLDKESNRSYRLTADKKKKKRKRGGRLATSSNSSKMSNNTAGTAIVSAVPGTTRDRRECIGRIGGTFFRLVDTAGVDGERLIEAGSSEARRGHTVMRAMMQQTLQAAKQAELVFLMFDARVGVTADLMETVRWLRKVMSSNKGETVVGVGGGGDRKIVLLANKLEGTQWNYDGSPVLDHLMEATRVGFGEAIPISAQHGEGMADLAVIIEELTAAKRQELGICEDDDNSDDEEEEEEEETATEKPLQLAILGRQNVGKSTLVNSLLQQERVITGATPGLTRDAIAIEWTWEGRPVQLVDTAGIRKRSKRDHSNEIEDLAVEDAMRAMKVADVAVLVLDAGALMLQRQELAILDAILKEGRAVVVAANKMDLIVESDYSKEDFAAAVREQLEARFPLLRKTPIVPMSSLTGESVQDLVPVVFQARDRWARTISTGQLNRWLAEVVEGMPPPPVAGRSVRIKYIMQTKGRPPTFLLFCNTDELPKSYIRYLTRNFQDTFEMFGMEVRLAVKQSATKNPYESTQKRGGSGLGGREARKQRMIHQLKTTGEPFKKRRRSKRGRGQ